eukprot:SM000288S10784  [mRNA]  locus=s288:109573:116835:- [translate_table: standard]
MAARPGFRAVLADNSDAPFRHLAGPGGDLGADQHPLEDVIRRVLACPPSCSPAEPPGGVPPAPLASTACKWVADRRGLEDLVVLLARQPEIGVDTEQHTLHSYRGYTALLQISIPGWDFLVDTIRLHDDIPLLRPIFADPTITKVFHGADNDVLWLQRDFQIYVVNLFDTARACDVLGKPQRSLAFLLRQYCGINTEKRYQKSDWTRRPLSPGQLAYARVDAHFLLHIAARLRHELLRAAGPWSSCNVKPGMRSDAEQSGSRDASAGSPKNMTLYERAAARSNLTTLSLYKKEQFSADTVATSLLSRYRVKQHNGQPMAADERLAIIVREICAWRDCLARTEDESSRHVLSDAALVAVAASAPATEADLFSTIRSADLAAARTDDHCIDDGLKPLDEALSWAEQTPSLVLRRHASSLMQLIQMARGEPKRSREESQSNPLAAHLALDTPLDTAGETGVSCEEASAAADSGLPRPLNGASSAALSTLSSAKAVASGAPRAWRRKDYVQMREQFVSKFSCKNPVYQNCRIYAGDGRLLCYCDRKKLDWYVQRSLAEYLDEEPPSVRLLFEPKGRPEDSANEFYIQSKANRCVGCGEAGHYLRYRLVPSCYRQYFPEHLKSHRSHDIVLLCIDCHEIAHKAAERQKRQVAEDFGIPLVPARICAPLGGQEISAEGAGSAESSRPGVEPSLLRRSAMALLRHGRSMPPARLQELEEVLRNYTGKEDVSRDDLEQALLHAGVRPKVLRGLRRAALLAGKTDDRAAAHAGVVRGTLRQEGGQITGAGGDDDDLTSSTECGKMRLAVQADHRRFTDGPASTCGVESRGQGLQLELQEEGESATRNRSGAPLDNCGAKQGGRELLQQTPLPSAEAARVPASGYSSGIEAAARREAEAPLGHSEHGRRVVGLLLASGGEGALRAFSQVWRSTFVAAVRPRFLPAGWAVEHSGHREFGDYSVYNPDRKPPAPPEASSELVAAAAAAGAKREDH